MLLVFTNEICNRWLPFSFFPSCAGISLRSRFLCFSEQSIFCFSRTAFSGRVCRHLLLYSVFCKDAFFFFKCVHSFTYFWPCCVFPCSAWTFSSHGEQGLSVVIHGLLIVVAFSAAEHRLHVSRRFSSCSTCPRSCGSRAPEGGLCSCGTWTELPCVCGIFPRLGIDPALAGRFLNSGPPGRSACVP